ncbi:hypothetical protein IKF02_03215 [Candidatus Saccharibacteria bacterium]|nr:hypothetical protein [Candidatus Saccharibacteria bacterium]
MVNTTIDENIRDRVKNLKLFSYKPISRDIIPVIKNENIAICIDALSFIDSSLLYASSNLDFAYSRAIS